MKCIILLLLFVLSAKAQSPECNQQQQHVYNACTEFSQCFTYDCSDGVCRNGVPLFSLCSDECKKQLDAVTSDCSSVNGLFQVEYCRSSPTIGQGASCYQTNYFEFCKVARSTSEYPECPAPNSFSTPNPALDSPSTPNPTPQLSRTPEPTQEQTSTPNPTPQLSRTPEPTQEQTSTPSDQSSECEKQQQQISDACTRLTECFTYDCSSGVCRNGYPLFSLCSDECKAKLNSVTSECSSINSLFRVEFCQSSPTIGQVSSCYWTNYSEFCKVARSTSEYPECPAPDSPSTQEPSSAPISSQTPTPSITPTPFQTPAPSITPMPSQTPKPSPAPTPFQTPKPSLAPTPFQTPTPTSSQTPEPSITPTPSQTPEPTGKPTSRPSSSPTEKPTLKLTSRPSSSLSPTPKPSQGLTPEPTFIPSPPLNDDLPSLTTRNFTSAPTTQAQPTANKSCKLCYLSIVISGACASTIITTVLTIAR